MMKWLERTIKECLYFDEIDGKIVGNIIESPFDNTCVAYYGKRELGWYISKETAMKAVEDFNKISF